VAANSDAIATSSERELVITRVLDAPREFVFKAWTEPEQVARWWGPKGFVTTFCEMISGRVALIASACARPKERIM
jgi:uncharacterized protein YndB with AHSA1/START domain